MLEKIIKKIESKRKSRNFFWKSLIFVKDFVWKICFYSSKVPNIFIYLFNDHQRIYNEEFYGHTISEELGSSKDLVNVLKTHFNPRSVIDIGCGCGIYLKAFSEIGIDDVLGYDISKSSLKKSLLLEKIKIHNLEKHLELDRKYDLCICVEVGEHISSKYSRTLVETLTKSSDIIFFTAASPGQGGRNHINEQPKSFWIKLFQEKGFVVMDSITSNIRKEMREKNVIWWVVKNLIVFKRNKN